MKKLAFLLAALVCCLNFTACSDDNNGGFSIPDLGSPAYERVSGKYKVSTPGSPISAVELTASGNYIITKSPNAYPRALKKSFHRTTD